MVAAAMAAMVPDARRRGGREPSPPAASRTSTVDTATPFGPLLGARQGRLAIGQGTLDRMASDWPVEDAGAPDRGSTAGNGPLASTAGPLPRARSWAVSGHHGRVPCGPGSPARPRSLSASRAMPSPSSPVTLPTRDRLSPHLRPHGRAVQAPSKRAPGLGRRAWQQSC